ncbi:MAG: NTP transferase domain-containing protein [Nitrospinae bacterium]|nr:NTP transferase domain-containing protein [Nitrospinota bacterium]
MKALILAGGRSPNMAPFSATRPNPLIPVDGATLMDHTLGLLKQAGVNLAHIVVGHESAQMVNAIPSDHPSGVKVHFVEQTRGSGIGHAVAAAKDRFAPGEHFLLVYGDTFTADNIFSYALQTYSLHNETTAAICHTAASEKYGNVYLDTDARITRLIEKPKKEEGLYNYVLTGVFVVSSTLFDHLDKNGLDMAAALRSLIKKETVRAAIWDGDWLDLAYPWDILTVNKICMDQWREARIHESVSIPQAELRGPVRIEKNVEICSGVVLQGPLFIGEGSFIGHHAIIRPYSYIGPGSVIGRGAEVKNAVLFKNVRVGSQSFIGDSVVGEKANFGPGCMTINTDNAAGGVCVRIGRKKVASGFAKLGAFIGDGAVVGASNTIAAGTVVEAGRKIDHNISVR